MNIPMSKVQIDALDIFDEISHRPSIDYMMRTGRYPAVITMW